MLPTLSVMLFLISKVGAGESVCNKENLIVNKYTVKENPFSLMQGRFSNVWVYPRREVILPRCSYTEFHHEGRDIKAVSEIKSIEGKVVKRVDEVLKSTKSNGFFYVSGTSHFYSTTQRVARWEEVEGRRVLVDITCEDDTEPDMMRSETSVMQYEGNIVVFHADQYVLGYSFCFHDHEAKTEYLVIAVRTDKASEMRADAENEPQNAVRRSAEDAKKKLGQILRELSLSSLSKADPGQVLEEMPKECL